MSIKISTTLAIDTLEYASQGNAILGIRDAGKTYTAMKVAEELLEQNIPVICYDPVGIWKNLKVGTGRHKGYPVVVAGGEGSDIRLSIDNAKDIVRAAMKENVSLVIDLYSPELINKSTWIKIVQETVDLLMYENKTNGLRHIFLEEAAEFIPQRLQQQHARVYASIERLARMGRNARLGYTLINQRAEEVNKAILEISEFSLLHRQVGKNSLASIQKWLELLQVDNAKQIIQTLPNLKQGECWAIGMRNKPQLIQVSPKKTFHPDPKNNSSAETKKAIVDVSSFVTKLNSQLKPQAIKKDVLDTSNNDEVKQLKQQLIEHEKLLSRYKKELDDLYSSNMKAAQRLSPLLTQFQQLIDVLSNNAPDLSSVTVENKKNHIVVTAPVHISAAKKLQKCPLTILTFLAQYHTKAFTKAQVGIATGYSPKSSGFQNAISELNTKNLIVKSGAGGDDGRIRIQVNKITNLEEWTGTIVPKMYSIETFKEKLGKCEREIYEVVLREPNCWFNKEDLASRTKSKYSSTSSGFQNALSSLNSLELIKREQGLIQLNAELKELM